MRNTCGQLRADERVVKFYKGLLELGAGTFVIVRPLTHSSLFTPLNLATWPLNPLALNL